MKNAEYLKELKALPPADLKTRARVIAQELMKLRFRSATGQLEQTHRLRELRRNLARVKTVIRTGVTKKSAE